MAEKIADVELSEGEQITGEVVGIWTATCNEDSMEGRGKTVDNSYHYTKHDALIATKGIGVMGGDGEVRPRKAVKLSDGRYFLAPKMIVITKDPEAAAKLREQALAKLSPAERAALLGSHE